MSTSPLELDALHSLTPVLITGDDSRKFLQGQLSNDIRRLTAHQALLASHNSGQGRVQTVLTLIDRPEGLFALIASHALTLTLERLQRFVLRERIQFHAEPADWLLAPVPAASVSRLPFLSVPEQRGHCASSANGTLLRWWSDDVRYLLLGKRSAYPVRQTAAAALDSSWRCADIAAGLPSVYPATRDAYVPQMLNLDVLQAVSYDKGCYVGQEIIARARRADVKRRMFRFSAPCTPPAPGTRILHDNVAVGEVVDAGGCNATCELLAVVDVARSSARLQLDDASQSALTALELPYVTVRAQPDPERATPLR